MKQFLFFSVFFLSIFGCAKTDPSDLLDRARQDMVVLQRNALPTGAEMLAELLVPVDGYFLLQSFTTQAAQDEFRSFQLDGYLTYRGTEHFRNFGDITFGDQALSFLSNNTYRTTAGSLENAYGLIKQLEIDGQGKASYDSEVVIPKLLRVTTPMESNHSNELFDGATITWEADEKNSRGIGILITYGKSLNKWKIIHTEDDGSYSFTSEDISEVLNDPGNVIHIAIGRGDYSRLVSDSTNHSLGFISASVVLASYYPRR